MPQVGIGEKIPLYMFLEDKDPGKFVQAVVKDPTGAQITGSPVGLSSMGDGSYSTLDLIMPNKDFVAAEFTVFDDAGFTIESVIHFPTAEMYEKDNAAEILDNDIINVINQISPPGASISVDMDQDDIEADIDGDTITADVDQDDIDVSIDSDGSLQADIDDENIETEIKDC